MASPLESATCTLADLANVAGLRARLMRHSRVPRGADGLPNVYACWEWQGTLNPDGYGVMRVGGDDRLVHRVAYIVFVGPVPYGRVVLHTCNNPRCWNPQHLAVGTQGFNTQLAVLQGRVKPPRRGRDGHAA